MKVYLKKIQYSFILSMSLFLIICGSIQKTKAMSLEATSDNLQTIGAQIRVVKPMGLRFLSCIDDSYLAELEKEGEVEYGTLILPTQYLGKEELRIDEQYLLKDKMIEPAVVPAKKIFNKKDGKTYFSAVLSNISEEDYKNDYTARAYVKITKEDGTVEIKYGKNQVHKQVYRVAESAVAGGIENHEVKTWLKENVIKNENKPDTDPSEEEKKISFQLGETSKVTLYQLQDGKVQEVKKFPYSGFHAKDYLAKVENVDRPTVFAEVKGIVKKDNKVYLSLNLTDYVYYEDAKQVSGALVEFGTLKGNEVVANSDTQNKANETNQVLESLKKIKDYQASHETIYMNLLKFMPYYNYEQIIQDGNKLPVDHKLNQNHVLAVYPLDEQGQRVVAMTQEEAQKVTSIRVQYKESGVAASIYNIKYMDTRNHIASYFVDQLGVNYNFKRYIVDTNSQVFKDVVSKAETYDFNKDIMNRPKGGENPNVRDIYRKNYNNVVKKEMADMFVSYFANRTGLTVNVNHPVAIQMVKDKLMNENYLKDYLSSYNYLDRWYDFVIGGVNMRDVILFDNEVTGKGTDPEALPIEMCTPHLDERRGNRTQDLYRNKIGKYTGYKEVADFVEFFMREYAGYADVNDWIIDNFQGGVIVEGKPTNPDVKFRAWQMIKKNSHNYFGDMIIPVLSYKTSKNLYIAAAPTVLMYGNLQVYPGYQNTEAWRNGKKKELESTVAEFVTIFDNFAKVAEKGAQNINKYAFSVIDQTPYKYGNQDVFVEFMKPIESFKGNGGHGAAITIRTGNSDRDYIYFNNITLLSSRTSLTHELGHITDSPIWMDGKGFRDGRAGEDVCNGFANQDSVKYNMNFMRGYAADGDKMSNLSPERINSDDKFKSYYKGVFETLNMLDYLQGKAYLELSPEQQSQITVRHYYGRMNGYTSQDKNGTNSTWKKVSAADLENMHLNSLDDLWKNQLMIRPGLVFNRSSSNDVGGNGTNGAYQIDEVAFASWYVPYVNNGTPNSQIFRRNAFELGGLYGYRKGLQEYMRYAGPYGDLERWRKITGDKNFTFQNWQKQKYEAVENNLKNIKENEGAYFDERAIIDYLKENMINYGNTIDEPLGKSLNKIKDSRENVFRYLHRITDQFNSSIYPDANSQVITKITSGEQLIDELSKNPSGIYMLTQDISMEGLEVTGNSYVNKTFIGKIDGNGHKITGMEKPLLNKIANSYVSDLTLVNKNGETKKELLAKTDSMTIHVTEHKGEKEIKTIEELQSIGNNQYDKYILKNDIDASKITNKDAVIQGRFKAEFDGGNYTISGLKAPLFENVDGGSVQNLKIKDADINKNKEYVAAVASRSNHAIFKNLELEKIKVEGQSYTAAVTGRDYTNSEYSQIQVRDGEIISNGNNGGGFIGRAVGTKITDVALLKGNVKMHKRGNGGFIGIAKDAKIDKVYSDFDLIIDTYDNEKETASAGFIGSVEGISKISHAFMAGNVENKVANKKFYKFVGTPEAIKNQITSSYELNETKGETNASDATKGKIEVASKENKKQKEFYIDQLAFSEEIWDLEWIADKERPELKGMESTPILHIHNTDDFERMNQHPDATFVLDADLIYTGQVKQNPLINKFTGVLVGNGHKITGLNVPLFDTLSGKVSNLMLEKSNVTLDGTKNQGAFAVTMKDAVIDEVALNTVTVESEKGHAAAFAGTIENSQLNNIHISNSKVITKDGNNAGFAVNVKDSSISNVAQETTLDIKNTDKTINQTSGGFIANIDDASKVSNIISIGNVPADVPKLMSNINGVTNAYEFIGADGISSGKTDRIHEAAENLWNISLYRDQLKFGEDKWSFDKIEERGFPVLKNIKSEYQPLRLEISKPEHISKLNKLPNKTFTITNDIDLSKYNGEITANKFNGVLEGNNRTISNLTKPLFNELTGTVRNLTLNHVKVENKNGPANALARTAIKANVSNLYVNGMTLSGDSYTGLIGTETSSTYENIGIENVKVYANADYAGIFIAEMKNQNSEITNIGNVLIGNGDVYTKDKQFVGGVIGKGSTAKPHHIVSDVDLHVTGKSDTNHSASFIGSGANPFSLRYSAILGGTYPDVDLKLNYWKITHVTDINKPFELNSWSNVFTNDEKKGTMVNHGALRKPQTWYPNGMKNPYFYQYDLVLDAKIWDLSSVYSKGYPKLKGMSTVDCAAPELNK